MIYSYSDFQNSSEGVEYVDEISGELRTVKASQEVVLLGMKQTGFLSLGEVPNDFKVRLQRCWTWIVIELLMRKKKVGYIKLGTCFFSVFFLKSFWSNYSDLTPNGGLVREISYFNQNLGEGEILFHLANFHRFGFGKESTVHASPFESHEKNSASWGFRPLCSVGLNCISIKNTLVG